MKNSTLQSAALLIKRHDENAAAKASENAAQLLASGDTNGYRVWKEIAVTAKLLVAREEMV